MKPAHQPWNILIVDDDDGNRLVLANHFRSTFDALVDTVRDGAGAIEHMKRKQYHLIVLEVLVPTLNGIEICQTMSFDATLRSVPVLLMSELPLASNAFQHSLQRYAELAVVKDIIEKPINPDELVYKTRNIIGAEL